MSLRATNNQARRERTGRCWQFVPASCVVAVVWITFPSWGGLPRRAKQRVRLDAHWVLGSAALTSLAGPPTSEDGTGLLFPDQSRRASDADAHFAPLDMHSRIDASPLPVVSHWHTT